MRAVTGPTFHNGTRVASTVCNTSLRFAQWGFPHGALIAHFGGGLGALLPPSPPAEKTTACQDQAGSTAPAMGPGTAAAPAIAKELSK